MPVKLMFSRAQFVAESTMARRSWRWQGARYPATHPLVKANPGRFEPALRAKAE